ncbi:MFS general substrate transporter [Obba rivulosa]|uniref:MFS general substrate transporter n=1 Tax=Obba rivulosa TaxID=1052685 RepID=A0A8E2AQ81_9APHY|nr:MFS general substrate transporter [Obba rivulosa]
MSERYLSPVLVPAHETIPSGKGIRFWLILSSLVVSLFLAILESGAIATALPTIVADLNGTQFLWVPSAYGLTSTALLPLSGGLAEVFGRRPIMLASLFLFAAGSAIGGASQSMNMLIAARAVQGAGAGGIFALSQIILSDMVTLQERGAYSGVFGLTWAAAGGVAPVIGGGLTTPGKWRWLFYLNVPIAGLSFFFVLLFLDLPTPAGTLREKLKRIDWLGSSLVMGSACACVIAFTWGGIVFPWLSAPVLAPLSVGLCGIIVYIVYETRWCSYPIVPASIISNRTSLSGYLQIFLCSFINVNLLYYLPIYYQACQDASPTASGIDIFGLTFTIAPVSVITGLSIGMTKRYRPQLWAGWAITIAGVGLLSIIREDTPRATSIGYQAVAGIGVGLVYSTGYFPVLAPLPVELNGLALAFYTFLRSLAQVWAVTIGGTILQNGLSNRLPASFSSHFNSDSAGIAYSVVPQIPSLPQPLKDEVRAAFARSLTTLWIVLVAMAGLGLMASLPMKGLPLHTQMDERWAKRDDMSGKQSGSGPSIDLEECS